MSGRRSRNKGSRGELQLAKALTAALAAEGVDLEINRTPNSGGLWIPGDVQGLPGFHIEVKRAETWKMQSWLDQASGDCPDGDIPLLFFRRNHGKWYCALALDDIAPLLAKALHPDGVVASENQPPKGDT